MRSPIQYLKIFVSTDASGDWDAVVHTELPAVTVQTILRKIILEIDKHGSKAKIIAAERRTMEGRREGDKYEEKI